MPETLRVVIAEDNYLVREGVRRLLEDSWQIDVLACVGDARELLDAVRRLSPSAVLTDIRMPPGHHMEGIEAARTIRTEYPGIGVVVLSQHTDESYARPFSMTAPQVWGTCSRIALVILRTSCARSRRWRPEDQWSIR